MSAYKCCYEQPRDFSVLRKLIAEKYTHEYVFAVELGMAKQTLSRKLNSIEPFTVSDICKICELLDIPETELDFYFRTSLVAKEEPKGIRDVIKEKFGTEVALARSVGMEKNTLGKRLNFQVDFRYSEILNLAKALELPIAEVVELLEVERGKADGQRTQSN